jgi:hypothetical protein
MEARSIYLGTTGQTGRFLIFCHGARENPERAVPVESHPFGFAQGRLLRNRPRKDGAPGTAARQAKIGSGGG